LTWRSSRPSILGVAVATLLCSAIVAAFVVPHLPYVPKEELIKTSLWGLAVLGAFAGWGTAVARFCWGDEEVSLSLRAVLGASLFTFGGGVLAASSLLSRGFLYLVVVVGCVLLGRSWIRDRTVLGEALVSRLRAARAEPAITCCVLFVAAGVALHYFGGAADISSNPYDDDIAYYPFAKQLLERGTLLDPFSFRRMSTLGGQALYHAILLLRVSVPHLNLFERAMCVLLAALLVLSPVDGVRIPLLARLLSVIVIIALPNTSINSASYYSGLVFFLALFQMMRRVPDGLASDLPTALRRCVPIALTGAALCTLRQNYQVTVAFFVLLSYGFAVSRLRGTLPIRQLLLEPATALVLTGIFVLPWLVLLYRSNQTFLFPLMKGTFRAGVAVRSQAMTTGKFARFFVNVWLQPEPIRTLPLFFLAGLTLREGGRPSSASSSWSGASASPTTETWRATTTHSSPRQRSSRGMRWSPA
jgi:hypothetical protein